MEWLSSQALFQDTLFSTPSESIAYLRGINSDCENFDR